jgi:hypothetical protein
MVAGVAAYLRALPSRWTTDLQDPRLLKALIKLLQRQIPNFPDRPAIPNAKFKVPTVWNGQVFDHSCLLDTKEADPKNPGFPGDSVCPNIDDIKKPDADKAVFSPGGSNDGPAIVFQPGPPSPTCTAHCGTLCTGFFCVPNPTGNPNAPTNTPTSPLPSLTGRPTGCAASQTPSPVQVCNGSGGNRVCVTSTSCVATSMTRQTSTSPSSGSTPTGPSGSSTPSPTSGSPNSCGASTPPATNPPPPGTSCAKDVDCANYLCPACQWAGCLKFSPASGLTCQCLPTLGRPAGQACGIDYDCASADCPAGQWPACLKFTMLSATCQCMDMGGEPPAGTGCAATYDCAHYTCPQGKHPGCVKFTMGGGPTCQCLPN